MKRRTRFLIYGGVAAAHALVICCIASWSPLPRVRYIPPDNFSVGWAKFTDPATHEKMVYQEFTVNSRVEPGGPTTAPH